ncbi:MAG: aminodeoxychorismate lyase [Dermatophilaceae bacterium]
MRPVIRVWVNGDLCDSDRAALSAIDHGVTVGDGVFETCKVVRGEVFAATRHRARLRRSAAGLGLPALDEAMLDAGIKAVLNAGDRIEFGRLRYTVTGGPGPLGSDRGDAAPSYIVTAAEAPRPARTGSLAVTPWTRNERSAVAGLKTTSYAENVVALAHAHERGAIEAVFANTRGELCECTGSNVFVVVGGEILTPPLSSGCLAGITRELAIEWCRDEGIPVVEEALPLSVLHTCSEVFITSSTRDILPVSQVDGRSFPAPGPVTARAADIFAARSAADLDP